MACKTSGGLNSKYLCGLWDSWYLLISGIPSTGIPLIHQKFTSKVVGWNMKLRGGSPVGGCSVNLKDASTVLASDKGEVF